MNARNSKTTCRLMRFASAVVFVSSLALAQIARAHGELLIRIAAVTKQIEAATNNPTQLYLERGELHREHQNWDAAESDYARAAQLDPTLAAVDFCRAKMLADAGKLGAAQAMFEKVIGLSPTNGEAFVGRARVLAKLGERKSAIADYRRGLDLLREPQPEYFLELAQAMAAEARPEDALHVLDEGLKKLGPVFTLQFFALNLELKRNNYDAALVRLDAIMERAARKENWLAQRGDILLTAGRATDARKAYEAALDAIKVLPNRLQQNPPLLKLTARLNAAIAGVSNGSVAQTMEWKLAHE